MVEIYELLVQTELPQKNIPSCVSQFNCFHNILNHEMLKMHRVSNFVTWFLQQFEAKTTEVMEIGNLLTKI